MKRFTILNSILLLWLVVFEFLFKSQGFFLAIFARQDFLHYLLFGPIIIGFAVFAIAYQCVGINWKEMKKNWQNLIAIILTPFIAITAFFTTEFYMMVVTWFQVVVILTFVGLIAFTGIWNLSLWIKVKTMKRA